MNKPIMTFNIYINESQISHMENAHESVTIIPFTGKVESELFTGDILPGAADVQVTDPSGCRHMCAKYMFTGQDRQGRKCHLYVENNGYFSCDLPEGTVIKTCPTFMTDSPVLQEYLSRHRFMAEVHGTKNGVDILVFDL